MVFKAHSSYSLFKELTRKLFFYSLKTIFMCKKKSELLILINTLCVIFINYLV